MNSFLLSKDSNLTSNGSGSTSYWYAGAISYPKDVSIPTHFAFKQNLENVFLHTLYVVVCLY